MFDVIEHLDDPFIFMQKLNGSLKKGGKFIFTTFDMDSLFQKLWGELSLDNAYAQILFFRKNT